MRPLLRISLLFTMMASSAMAAVNVNTASKSELTQFNGVGPATADKIIVYRDTNGPFASCDDLVKVKGIGPATLGKIKPTCTTGAAE